MCSAMHGGSRSSSSSSTAAALQQHSSSTAANSVHHAPTAHSLQGIPQHTPNLAPCQVSLSTFTISASFPTAASPRRRRSIRYFFTRYKQKRQTEKPNYMQQVVWTFLPTSLQITNSPCANNELTMRAHYAGGASGIFSPVT